jgi:hypothetical protein
MQNIGKNRMENKKIKTLSRKQASTALNCIRDGIDFNLDMGHGVFIMFVGGNLSKLVGDEQFVYIRERGWVGI